MEEPAPVIVEEVDSPTILHLPSQDGGQPSLQFDSVFESGNLAVALRSSECEYDLILQNDINTKGHTQCKLLNIKVYRVLFQGRS